MVNTMSFLFLWQALMTRFVRKPCISIISIASANFISTVITILVGAHTHTHKHIHVYQHHGQK